MTDRLPIVDGAPACPFVAFEDDRDARALAPDHRHRCFAEPRPAPRALAHQEAYCLSSAFPVCPTFQDWARREAAAARPAPAGDRAALDEPPVSRPLPPREREPRHAQDGDTPPPIPPRRHQARDWAAPPPWSEEGSDGSGAGAASLDAGVAAGALWGASAGASAGGATGAAAAQGGAAGSDPAPRAPRAGTRPPGGDDATPPPFLAARTPSPDDDWGTSGRGLAGSAADRLAGPGDDEPSLPRVSRAPLSRTPAGNEAAFDDLDDVPRRDEWPAPPARGTAAPAGRRPADRRPAPPPAGRGQGHRPRDEDPESLFGPAWERPRRYEAYPSLRTRVGLPSFSNLWIAVAALVLAGVVLFFVGPMLLGLGGDSPGTGGRPTAVPSAEATASASPTLPPEPTPQVYVVAKGDTMSRIAKRFGVTVEQLLDANKQIKNADRIKIGDQLTIPVPVPDELPAEASVEP